MNRREGVCKDKIKIKQTLHISFFLLAAFNGHCRHW